MRHQRLDAGLIVAHARQGLVGQVVIGPTQENQRENRNSLFAQALLVKGGAVDVEAVGEIGVVT